MQIIIPMTGYGSRFVTAGYKDLKPLIKVQGRPIIEWIVRGMYSDDDKFIFVCREEHLNKISGMREFLLSLASNVQIHVISNWMKKGPVYDVLRASDVIDDFDAAIINYCDFYMVWNWQEFKDEVAKRSSDGAIPCYTGFHPNLLPVNNYYASCLTDDKENLVEIREKFSFEKDKIKAKHSPGVYYFKSGAMLKKYCKKLIESNITIKDEFYASMVYNFLVNDGLKVWVPVNVQYFCQWGTPEDLEEYLFWTEVCRRFK